MGVTKIEEEMQREIDARLGIAPRRRILPWRVVVGKARCKVFVSFTCGIVAIDCTAAPTRDIYG